MGPTATRGVKEVPPAVAARSFSGEQRRQFTTDCHSEARSAARGIRFVSGYNRFLASLGMTSIGLMRRTCNYFSEQNLPGEQRRFPGKPQREIDQEAP